MFEGSQRYDRIERFVRAIAAPILKQHLDIRQLESANESTLIRAKCQPDRVLHAAPSDSVLEQSSPATTDVEKALCSFGSGLLDVVIELSKLGAMQVVTFAP